jgi:hypothetical protein
VGSRLSINGSVHTKVRKLTEESSPGTDVSTVVQAFHAYLRRGALDSLLHEEAEVVFLPNGDVGARGPDEVAAALQRLRAWMNEATVTEVEPLDDRTAIVRGHGRYPLPGRGFADGLVFWLEEIRDGLVWRVRAFTAREEALAAYEHTMAGGDF